MIEFFNQQLHLFGLFEGDGNPVLACKIDIGRNYAFLEVHVALHVIKNKNKNIILN